LIPGVARCDFAADIHRYRHSNKQYDKSAAEMNNMQKMTRTTTAYNSIDEGQKPIVRRGKELAMAEAHRVCALKCNCACGLDKER
jgi:hypothetical protein